MIENIKDKEEKIWYVYVTMTFGENYKYNFKGTYKDLFTLIGVIHSSWFVQVNDIRYCTAKEYNKDYKLIEVRPYKDTYRTYERSI